MNTNCIRIWNCLLTVVLACWTSQTSAEDEAFQYVQSELGKSLTEYENIQYQCKTVKGLFFSPCCGTLFQWSAGSDCSGGPQLDKPLQTDRPNFTSTSVTVGKGVSQLESGYTYLDDKNSGRQVSTQSFGEFLFRRGIVADWLEFRIGFSPLQQSIAIGTFQNTTVGSEDLYTALQFALTPQTGAMPEMAIIVQMSIPTGSPAFTSHKLQPGLDWVYAWELNEFISIAASTQGNQSIDDNGRSFLEIAQSFNVSYTLTEQWGAFTEWFALIPSGANTAETEHYFDAGFTYLINNNLQLDISAGVGLNEAAINYFVGAGVSIRFL
ncbi:transporter [Gimesia aquarii]|uniref:Transporter n=1 Tax=Gimesia aquarii TaxID=2527964 RepID=A0A517VSF7_9PLAN|nr:transporter [Gimesia aquarii]QDT95937.1 hypothetical protein V144x_13870 [Gimesia aquarii]